MRGAGVTRAMFAVMLVLIAAGIVFAIVVGALAR
jgi:hypothetical protein